MQWIEDLQDDHPVIWRVGITTLLVGGLFSVLMLLPDNGFFQATGISAGRRRLADTQHAVFWTVRSKIHTPAVDQRPEVIYGTLLGVDKDRRLLVSVADGDEFVQRSYIAADVAIRDAHAAAVVVAAHQFADVRLDVYETDQAVVWLGDRPLNLMLIEAGVAAADPSPPTNIVDAAFAAYYWRRVKSGEEDHTHAPN